MNRAVTVVALICALLAVSCKRKPSVFGVVEENRAEINAYVAKVKTVESKLAGAPTEASGFTLPAGTISSTNTVVILEQDFPKLLTDILPRASYADWDPDGEVGPSTEFHVQELIKSTRKPKPNPPDHHTEVIQRCLEVMRKTRFVAVPKTLEVEVGKAAGTIFTPSRWVGLVRVYDLEKQGWAGAVKVTVGDNRTTATRGSVLSNVNSAIDNTITKALNSGQDTEGRAGL